MSNRVAPTSLEWALAHLNRFGDSDLLATPFEYKAIAADWIRVKRHLTEVDLAEYETRSLERYLVPKPEGGFRVATRLDPLDALLYTAAVYETLPNIEANRVPRRRKIACAYRFSPKPDGSMFGDDTGWADFYARSVALSNQEKYRYVVLADVSDFYSQISHHRVCNALESAGVGLERAAAIERLLSNWSALQSRGLPVGPQASIPLAEACLNDVDHFILAGGFRHLRYVDDFRIFCSSREEAHRALHDLSEYLYTAHRLSLTTAKTKILPTAIFLKHWLENAEFLERQNRSAKVAAILERLEVETGYVIAEEQLADDDKFSIAGDTILELFKLCLATRHLRLGLARHVLRRAGAIRTNKIQALVLENLVPLTAVLRDAIVYLERSTQNVTAPQVVSGLNFLATSSDLAFLPLVQDWVVQTLSEHFSAHSRRELQRMARRRKHAVRLRLQAQIALSLQSVDWVRKRKESWLGAGAWDRRAIIAAGAALPSDERRHWCRSIVGSGDVLDAAVARYFLQE